MFKSFFYHYIRLAAISGAVLCLNACLSVGQSTPENTVKDEQTQLVMEYENEYAGITILHKEGSKLRFRCVGHDLSKGIEVDASTDGLSNSECIVQMGEGKFLIKKSGKDQNLEQYSSRPFYVMNSQIAINGNIRFSKGGATINGIYLMNYPDKASRKAVKVSGLLKREPYPRAYYSTPESPQGMFPDDGKVRYRLIFETYSIADLPKQIYEGTCMNIDGKAYFIWDYADSAAYLLDEAPLWEEGKIGKKIKIEAATITESDGTTLLCNWKLLE